MNRQQIVFILRLAIVILVVVFRHFATNTSSIFAQAITSGFDPMHCCLAEEVGNARQVQLQLDYITDILDKLFASSPAAQGAANEAQLAAEFTECLGV